MKRTLIIPFILFAFNVHAIEKTVNSVNIYNTSEDSIELYINGNFKDLKEHRNLRISCLPEENVTINYQLKSVELPCGKNLELTEK